MNIIKEAEEVSTCQGCRTGDYYMEIRLSKENYKKYKSLLMNQYVQNYDSGCTIEIGDEIADFLDEMGIHVTEINNKLVEII